MNSTSTQAAPPQPAAVDVQKRYRPEIEGLRIVAAVLVAVYHIWFLRVSGGVDVFFVVSGFLVTTSLLTRYNRERTVKFRPFVLGLLKRLLPNALVVLLFVTVVGFFVLPEVRYGSTIRELLASLFYYENWELAVSGTDYLDQTNEKSPVQHFWAMSIQGQFYIALFLVVAGAVFVARRTTRSLGPVLVACLSSLLALSLLFSVYLTHVDQPWAYFDTRARVWEFAIGGLLALFISRVKLPRRASAVLGWVGLLVLITTGMLLDVGGSFPGFVALVPVGAAVLILLAGQNPTPRGVESLLGSRAMVRLGGFSYGLYLWHWPLLSFHYVVFDTKEVGLLRGVLIILAALGLSVLSTIFIERRMGNHVARFGPTTKGFAPILALAMVVLLAIVSWLGLIRMQSHALQQQAVSQDYPGAVAMQPGYPDLPVRTPLPTLIDIKEDKAKPYSDGCHQQKGSAEVLVCEYGRTEGFEYTVAVVGGSKSAHWLPSIESFAGEEAEPVKG